MAITTASAKAKGRNLQKSVVSSLLERHPTLTADDVVSCPMGSNGADIKLSQAAKAAIPFDFECKARAKIAMVYEALDQARRSPDRIPLAVIKADRKRPLAVIDLETFLSLISDRA
ncbi:hypothetical protein QH494_02570 [Sphingomonas sp. AR_OL41]|uniref:hypothetical protein n=1 Tax=Sphingomonas sp. AR_OL41 TaxID=3042729 RepID=UPI002480F59C|nr:hypothetical protein [Sphingomonas sp. AR_OL41]MDH7971053.1 hypothetical protein [Sphingomonas sp. AR_OL41]